MSNYVRFTVKIEPETFGGEERQERILVRSHLIDCIKDMGDCCEVLLSAGLGKIIVAESFDTLEGYLE